MLLDLDFRGTEAYKSRSQQMRVATESWVARNMFCPVCGAPVLNHYGNNKPVADFYCNQCQNDFELKSSTGNKLGKRIADGAYYSMLERIRSFRNPHFLFMAHDEREIRNLIFVPNYFFTPYIIEPRKPLLPPARRAGWIGCNILLTGIPESGKIYIVRNGEPIEKGKVLERFSHVRRLSLENLNRRGWMVDVLKCVEQMPNQKFTLQELYAFSDYLSSLHPENKNVQAKIRQQLQFLRSAGLIVFLGRGVYQRL